MSVETNAQKPPEAFQEARPTLVLMHFLGGSGREWDEVVALLGPAYPVLRVDLPGFGDAAGETGYSVAAMVEAVERSIAAAGLRRFVLVGHSMSGKVAMVLARRLGGRAELAGLVLVAASPPGPEPIPDEKRGSMIASLGGAAAADDLVRARSYITKNERRDIDPAVVERTAHEVLRMNRTAWVAWLTHGSKEDWAKRVGVLDVPALVVAGEKDEGLGPEAQRRLTLPHLGRARMRVVEGCSHLVPLERPEAMAELLREFVAELVSAAIVPAGYLAFLASDRVSLPTQAVVRERIAGPAGGDGVLTALEQRTLRAVLDRVVPQQADRAIDLAGFVMARLGRGAGDGWRYAELPDDLTAYRENLGRLAEDDFAELAGEAQDRVLAGLAAEPESARGRWFEEVRGDAAAAYMGHPATLARVGYSGFGVGGAHTPRRGYVQVGIDEREAWEPLPEVGA